MAAKSPQLSVRMEPMKITLLKRIAEDQGKSLNQFVDDELTALIAKQSAQLVQSVRRKADEVQAAVEAFAAQLGEQEEKAITRAEQHEKEEPR